MHFIQIWLFEVGSSFFEKTIIYVSCWWYISLFAEQATLPIQYWVFEAKNKTRKCLQGMRTNTDAWLTLSAPLTNHFPDVANAYIGAWVTSTTEMFPSILHSLVMWQNYTHFFIPIFGHCTSFKNTDNTCWRWNERWVDRSALIKMWFEQECIPVGCVPSTAVTVSGGERVSGWGCLPGGCLPRGVSA